MRIHDTNISRSKRRQRGGNEMKGNVIRYARQAHGLSQTALARLLNTTQLSVCRWETDNQKPQPNAEKRIKEVLGLTERDIIEIETLLRDEQHRKIQERLLKKAQL
jgi:transcriptional regulator with XRE-family HTH domain